MILKHITKMLLLTVPLFFCGCGSLIKQPAPVISYYQLDYKPEISNTTYFITTILINTLYIFIASITPKLFQKNYSKFIYLLL